MSGLVDFFREARPYLDAAGAALAVIAVIGAGLHLGVRWVIRQMRD